jgi:hypothetical protein
VKAGRVGRRKEWAMRRPERQCRPALHLPGARSAGGYVRRHPAGSDPARTSSIQPGRAGRPVSGERSGGPDPFQQKARRAHQSCGSGRRRRPGSAWGPGVRVGMELPRPIIALAAGHPHKVNAGAMAAADHLRAAGQNIYSQTVRDPASVQK